MNRLTLVLVEVIVEKGLELASVRNEKYNKCAAKYQREILRIRGYITLCYFIRFGILTLGDEIFEFS